MYHHNSQKAMAAPKNLYFCTHKTISGQTSCSEYLRNMHLSIFTSLVPQLTRKIPSEMEVAPLHNPFDPQIHNLFKNFRKFKTKKSEKQIHINLEQNEDCLAYAQSYTPAQIMHLHSRLRRSGFYCDSLCAFSAKAVTEHRFKTRHNFAPCLILHFA